MSASDATNLNLRILVVEDEVLIAMMLEDILQDMGCALVGNFPSLSEALEAVDGIVADAAVLDVNVAGRPVFPLAEKLAARGLPIVFSTGYGAGALPERWRIYPVVSKPFDPGALRAGLIAAMSLR